MIVVFHKIAHLYLLFALAVAVFSVLGFIWFFLKEIDRPPTKTERHFAEQRERQKAHNKEYQAIAHNQQMERLRQHNERAGLLTPYQLALLAAVVVLASYGLSKI